LFYCEARFWGAIMRTFICGAAILIAVGGTAFGQAGSTGGTLGNTDKSISGERREEPSTQPKSREPKPHAARKASENASAARSGCQRIVGTWKWGLGFTVIIKSDGTAHHSGGGDGTWTCQNGRYAFVWSIGITDHVSLSADGNSVVGSNNVGTFSGNRI
jgi:hypothetical protein